MSSLRVRIVALLKERPGLTDREITDILFKPGAPQQPVNQICRQLQAKGIIARRKRSDGRIGNYPCGNIGSTEETTEEGGEEPAGALSEDAIKGALERWLQDQGWKTRIAWGKERGIDIEARRGSERWIIEVKGPGSLSAMRVNYFLGIIGELLQRMDDPNARYSIALPDLKQFRLLWQRLPYLAKSRTTITALFVDTTGAVDDGN
jgi:hypothetical protein